MPGKKAIAAIRWHDGLVRPLTAISLPILPPVIQIPSCRPRKMICGASCCKNSSTQCIYRRGNRRRAACLVQCSRKLEGRSRTTRAKKLGYRAIQQAAPILSGIDRLSRAWYSDRLRFPCGERSRVHNHGSEVQLHENTRFNTDEIERHVINHFGATLGHTLDTKGTIYRYHTRDTD
jgi:hypothetical protein